jgi:catechol 2,3-dioxygenase-like lactoylglutathione lyase family enzyme
MRKALKEAAMGSAEARSSHASMSGQIDMHLEVDVIPVSDADRAKQFYQGLGWRLDDDSALAKDVRTVQFTPPGSACSVTFGTGITTAAPGSAEATLTVADIEAAHDELLKRGIHVSDVWHGAPFPVEARLGGPDPAHTSYGSFCAFSDPDGDAWLVQEVTARLPGRI